MSYVVHVGYLTRMICYFRTAYAARDASDYNDHQGESPTARVAWDCKGGIRV